MTGIKVYRFQENGSTDITVPAVSGVLTPIYTNHAINGKLEMIIGTFTGTSNGSIFLGISGISNPVLTLTACSGTNSPMVKYPVVQRSFNGTALIGASGNVWTQPSCNDTVYLAGSGLAEVGSTATIDFKLYYTQP